MLQPSKTNTADLKESRLMQMQQSGWKDQINHTNKKQTNSKNYRESILLRRRIFVKRLCGHKSRHHTFISFRISRVNQFFKKVEEQTIPAGQPEGTGQGRGMRMNQFLKQVQEQTISAGEPEGTGRERGMKKRACKKYHLDTICLSRVLHLQLPSCIHDAPWQLLSAISNSLHA